MVSNKIRLIVGLGNVGAKYDHTRHNMGCDLLFSLAEEYRIDLKPEGKFAGLVGKGQIENQDVFLLFPTTFMNESGRAVSALASFYKIPCEEILVLHDELDLLPGKLKLKFGGGLAGHNGLKSICALMGSNQNFWRLRIGIGKPQNKDVISYVLGKPAPSDRAYIEEAFAAARHGISQMFSSSMDRATSTINSFKIAKE